MFGSKSHFVLFVQFSILSVVNVFFILLQPTMFESEVAQRLSTPGVAVGELYVIWFFFVTGKRESGSVLLVEG